MEVENEEHQRAATRGWGGENSGEKETRKETWNCRADWEDREASRLPDKEKWTREGLPACSLSYNNLSSYLLAVGKYEDKSESLWKQQWVPQPSDFLSTLDSAVSRGNQRAGADSHLHAGVHADSKPRRCLLGQWINHSFHSYILKSFDFIGTFRMTQIFFWSNLRW